MHYLQLGFFKRGQNHAQIKQWKKESLYNRRSQRMSQLNKEKPPYNAMEGNGAENT